MSRGTAAPDGHRPDGAGLVAADPRLPAAGWRILAPATAAARPPRQAEWDHHRISLGLPDGSRDLEAEKTVLLEAGFDELNGDILDQGLLHGPGAHRPHQISGPDQTPPDPGRRSRARSRCPAHRSSPTAAKSAPCARRASRSASPCCATAPQCAAELRRGGSSSPAAGLDERLRKALLWRARSHDG